MKELFKFFKKEYFYLCKNAIEDLAYPIETQILKFWIFGVVIYPEMHIEILKPWVKELAQSDLPFFRCGQKTEKFQQIFK